MEAMTAAHPARAAWRAVALPAEHGSWGFVFEPLLLGLLAAPSLTGAWLAAAAFALFLLHRPLKIMLTDLRRGRLYARTRLARRFAGAFGLLALLAGAAVLRTGGGPALWPLLPALPFFGVYLAYDLRSQQRSWQAELAAPLAFGAFTAAIGLGGGLATPVALALWLVICGRAIPSILYIRARLRLEKGRPFQARLSTGAHALALLTTGALVGGGLLTGWVLIAPIVLLLRALVGLSSRRRRVSVPRLGAAELGYGLLTVLCTAVAV